MNVAELRQAAKLIWEAALHAADPATCIRNCVAVRDDVLVVAGKKFPVRGRVTIIGTGKAGARMAQVIEEILGDHVTGGLVVTKYGHALPLKRIRLIEAGHPIPDTSGIRAVEETRRLLRNSSED